MGFVEGYTNQSGTPPHRGEAIDADGLNDAEVPLVMTCRAKDLGYLD